MRILFLGTKQLGLRIAAALCNEMPETLAAVVTIDDREDLRSQLGGFVALASEHGLALHIASSRKHCEEIVQSERPDYCLVAGWYWLLSESLLASVPGGFIGIHNSLLPRYRGFSPLVWTLMNGDLEAGYSIFSLASGMDEGPLWLQRRVPVDKDDYIGDVLGRIEAQAPADFVAVLGNLLAGDASSAPQSSIGVSYCARRLPEDGRIDWKQPADRIRNMIRALSDPYPGAFSFVGETKLRVWRADTIEAAYYGLPGQIAGIDSDGSAVVVAGDSHAIRLREVETMGSRGTPATHLRKLRVRSLSDSP